MNYDFSPFQKAGDSALEWLRGEYAGIRANRASPDLLDSVLVSAYGSKKRVKELGTISVEGPKSLKIDPWDKSLLKDIDSALREANLNLSVSSDSNIVRVALPDLTSDTRNLLIKTAKDKLEEAKITIRKAREKLSGDMDKGDMSKDDSFRAKAQLQKLVDEYNKKLEEIFNKKEKEIRE